MLKRSPHIFGGREGLRLLVTLLRMPLTIRAGVTHQGQVTVQAEVGPGPLNSGATRDLLQNTTTSPQHEWLQAKRQTIPSVGRDVGKTGSLMHH